MISNVIVPGSAEAGTTPRGGMTALIYGDSGAGKTTLLGTLPNPLILATDRNTVRLRKIGKAYRLCPGWGDLEAAMYEIMAEMSSGTFQFSELCVDAISATEDHIRYHANPNKGKVGLKDWTDTIIPVWGDLVRNLLDFANPMRYPNPIDIFLTARISYEKSEADGRMWAMPEAPGKKLGPQLYAWVDHVYHLKAVEELNQAEGRMELVRYLRTCSDAMFTAKDGSGILEPEIREPDLGAIKQRIVSALG